MSRVVRRGWLGPASAVVLLGWPATGLAQGEPLFGAPPTTVANFVLDASGAVLARTAAGRGLRVEIEDDEVGFRDVGALPSAPAAPAAALPDGIVETGSGEIAAAWLTEPTTRYTHGVLGDVIEAGGFRVRFRDGGTAELRLGPGQVFEDRRVRIVDSDGDGRDELLVVRSDVARGAALALYEASGGTIRLRAAAAPIGRPNRWLNSIGVADFDGDGRREIAAVLTPHLAGRLTLFRQEGAALVPVLGAEGYSNHAVGSRELGMAAVADVDGDGTAEAIVPVRGHREVALVSFAGGQLREIARVRHAVRVVTNIVVGLVSGVRAAVYGLSDGAVAVVPLPGGA